MYLYGVLGLFTAILGLLFTALVVLFGYSILSALKMPLKGLEIIAASPIVGIVAAGWLCVLPYFITGSLDAGIIVASAVMLLVVLWLRPGLPSVEPDHRNIVIVISLIAFAFVFLCLFTYYDGEYHAAYPFYGDASFHSTMITSFAEGYNYPPNYPIMAGQAMHYTFLIDFFSAELYRLGLGLQWSIVLPGWLLLSGLLSLLYFAGQRFTGRKAGGLLALALVICSGGLGFLAAANDLNNSGLNIGSFLQGNLNYTTMWSYNLVFTNFIVIVLAQRTALTGFAVGALIMLVLYVLLVQRQADEASGRNALMVAGVLAGLLPLFHVYSYIAIILSSALLLLIFRERKWYYFMAPALLLAIPQALWISGQMGTSHFKIELGWMAGSLANMPAFWLWNMGAELLLLIAGLFIIDRKNLKFYLPYLAIFAMASVFVFQPWDYDNHKFFSFWLMPSSFVMAAALLKAYGISNLGKVLAALLLILAVLTGAITAGFILFHPYVEISSQDVHVGEWIMQNTPKDAVFLTSNSPISAVTSYAGRKTYLGYEGWLWTHGVDYSQRQVNVRTIYNAEDEAATMHLIALSGIDYIYIGPSEAGSSQYTVNRTFFDSNFECVFDWIDPVYGGSYRIYKV